MHKNVPAGTRLGATVGIIGGGPRCLAVLQQLYLHTSGLLSQTQSGLEYLPSLNIVVIEPSDHIGAGKTYDPAQPKHLRMNNDVTELNVFVPELIRVFPQTALSFKQWTSQQQLTLQEIPPRGLVGSYLNYAASVVITALEKIYPQNHVNFRQIKSSASDVVKKGYGYEIYTDQSLVSVDALAIATGHASWDEHASKFGDSQGFYDLTKFAKPSYTAKEEPIFLIEGMGLTAIDTCIGLSQRHSYPTKTPADNSAAGLDHEHLELMVLTSRTERMMLPKASFSASQLALFTQFISEASMRLDAHLNCDRQNTGFFKRVVLPEFFATSNRIATELWGRNADCETWLHSEWPNYTFRQSINLGKSIVSKSYNHNHEVACAAALGFTLKALLPCINHHGDFGQMSADDRYYYQAFRQQLEKIAFGPVSPVIDEFYELVDSGRIKSLSEAGIKKTETLHKIRANLPGPHANFSSGVYRSLLEQNLVTIDVATGALCVNKDGSAVKPDGSSDGSLAIFSRASEDWVAGMDSLNHINHSMVKNWVVGLANSNISNQRSLTDYDIFRTLTKSAS